MSEPLTSALRQEGPQQDASMDGLIKMARCQHTKRGGGNDYILCDDCGLMWDYRKESPSDGLVNYIKSQPMSASRTAPQEEEIDPALETARALVEDVCECGDCDGEHSGKREHVYGPPDGPCAREGCSCEKFKAASLSVSRIPAIDSPSASRTAQAPQQEGLRTFIARIAERRFCDDPGEAAKCDSQSGPYCGEHDFWPDEQELVVEARRLLAEIDLPLNPAPSADLAAAQARIQVLETSVDYLRYLVDHPVTQELWRPIETAKEDGEIVLVFDEGAMFRALIEKGRWIDIECDQPIVPPPSHWMPMPSPPSIAPPVAPAEGEP